jgi:hypothetical protein
MPWYGFVYLGLFLALAIAGFVEDWHSGKPWRHRFDYVTATSFESFFIIAFWREEWAAFAGTAVLPMLAFALWREVSWSIDDWRDMQNDEELGEAERALGVGLALAFVTPVYVMGAILAWNAVAAKFA